MPKLIQGKEIPDVLRPFVFHGMNFITENDGRGEAQADCPFCGGEGKWAIRVEDGGPGHEVGLWNCIKCKEGSSKGGGNLRTFLQLLWAKSDASTNGATTSFAAERGLLFPETLTHWGVCQSCIDGSWLIPGHLPSGKLGQLYKRIHTGKRWEPWPTPAVPPLGHAMHGIPLFNQKHATVHVHESWGNALAFWEIARLAKLDKDKLVVTGNEASSILGDASVLAAANCGAVGASIEPYLPLMAGKRVVMHFDNDHPKTINGKVIEGAGLSTSRRLAGMLAKLEPPCQVEWVEWGSDGWNPDVKPGYDVRDLLGSPTLQERLGDLDILLELVKPVPAAWVSGRPTQVGDGAKSKELEPLACSSWTEMINDWRKAIRLRPGLEDVLAVMAAVSISTLQVGDQLFLQLVGDAGSTKSTFCDAFLVSKSCEPLDHLTGFFSGWKDESGDDYSLLTRLNGKTLITSEGDIIMSSPNFDQIMSQLRRIFDGTVSVSFKNRKDSIKHSGLRTPWIMAGTPAMLDRDQSRLGDRFLRVWVDRPEEDERREILRKVGYTALSSVVQHSDGHALTQKDARLARAYRITGGFVDHLRANATKLLEEVEVDAEMVVERCASLAEFTAHLRARPAADFHKRESAHTKELPSRLTHQFCRLARCLAAVLQRKSVDDDVMRIVRKVAALDMARGWPLEMCKFLSTEGSASSHRIAAHLTHVEEWAYLRLRFLKDIGVAEHFTRKGSGSSQVRWKMTDRMTALWQEVMSEE